MILDEIQYVPDLFRELKIVIDQDRRTPARWIVTGSQKFALLQGARESLAGRLGILELDTLGAGELRPYFAVEKVETLLFQGGFPEIWADPDIDRDQYLDDYITTYLEKDLRAIVHTPNLRDFHRFMRGCALRCGALVNYTDLTRDTGISPNTAKSWMNTLVQSGVATLLEPWFGNMAKRMAKRPKFYYSDQGLMTRLLNISGNTSLDKHPLAGSIWENLVFNELIRTPGVSPGRNLFYYRDQNKVEVDFVVEKDATMHLIEAKFAERPGKTNHAKVIKALKDRKTSALCACRVDSDIPVSGSEYTLINPLKCGFDLM